MPVITFTLSDAAAAELVDALCKLFSYAPVNGDGVPNPETRAQFSRRMMRLWLVGQVKQYRREIAASTANATDLDIT